MQPRQIVRMLEVLGVGGNILAVKVDILSGDFKSPPPWLTLKSDRQGGVFKGNTTVCVSTSGFNIFIAQELSHLIFFCIYLRFVRNNFCLPSHKCYNRKLCWSYISTIIVWNVNSNACLIVTPRINSYQNTIFAARF